MRPTYLQKLSPRLLPQLLTNFIRFQGQLCEKLCNHSVVAFAGDVTAAPVVVALTQVDSTKLSLEQFVVCCSRAESIFGLFFQFRYT